MRAVGEHVLELQQRGASRASRTLEFDEDRVESLEGPASREDGLLVSGLAHLWLLTIHPFGDGNGLIARALAKGPGGGPRTSYRLAWTPLGTSRASDWNTLASPRRSRATMGIWKHVWIAALISTLSACSCTPPERPDAGVDDDAGQFDSGHLVDAGEMIDAGEDAGIPDAGNDGVEDGGPADSGVEDAGTADAGVPARWIARAPSPRRWATLTWDPHEQRLLLYGGQVVNTSVSDLWSWDQSGWAHVDVSLWPPDRQSHSAAWDAVRNSLVVFGGYSNGTVQALGDTWLFDGTRWLRGTPTRSPPPPAFGLRDVHAMQWDPSLQKVLLLATGSGGTWSWDGSDWTNVTSTGPVDSRPLLAWDAARQRMVCFGTQTGTTWEWAGASWTQRTPASSPPGASEGQMAFDSLRQRVVLVLGRQPGTLGGTPTETWEWDGMSWTDVTQPDGSPPVGTAFSLEWDDARSRLVLIGGSNLRGEVWERVGAQWTSVTGKPRGSGERAFDPVRREFVLFGGLTGGVFTGVTPWPVTQETWVRSGTSWTQKAPQVSPQARAGASLGWDPISERLILFSGSGANGTSLGDTWAWDGTNWSPLSPATSPPDGPYTAAVIGPDGGTLHLVGGPQAEAEVWKWTGATWSRVPGSLPIASRPVSASWDPVRERALFLSQERLVEWDAIGAFPSDAGVVVTPRHAAYLAWHPVRERTIVTRALQQFPNGLGWQEASAFFEWDGVSWVEIPLATSDAVPGPGGIQWDPLLNRVVMSWENDWWLEH